MPHSSQLGAKLGPKIAKLVVDAQVDHLRKSARLRSRIEADGRHEFWRDIAKERDTHIGPLYQLLLGHPDTDPAMERTLKFMSSHRGELAGMLTHQAVGMSMGGGLTAGVANILAPINQRIMEARPQLTLGLSDIVQAFTSGVYGEEEAYSEAARNGIDRPRFQVLAETAFQYPDFSTLLELWRRGQVGRPQVEQALHRSGIRHDWAAVMLDLKQEKLSVADAALAVLRGHLTPNEGALVAQAQGYTTDDFETIIYNTGEPPAAEQMMEALRRGFTDDAEFEKAIRQSRIRDEWIPLMKRLRYTPMATADAIQAVVRNYITPQEGAQIAQQNGLEPAQYKTLLLAHGRPPGMMQMMSLWNRGEASQEQVEQSIRESDVKDKYVKTLLGLRYRIPPERMITTLVQHGAMTEKRAHELLLKDGYEPDVATSLIKAGAVQRTAGHKQLTLSNILLLYEQHALTEQETETHIVALGYPKTDVPLLLKTAELKRELKWRDAAVTAIRAGYLAYHTTLEEARGELSSAGVPAEQAAHLLELWPIERKAHRRTLTEAQVLHSMRQGHLTKPEAQERLQNMGYGPNDAAFLIQSAGPVPKGA